MTRGRTSRRCRLKVARTLWELCRFVPVMLTVGDRGGRPAHLRLARRRLQLRACRRPGRGGGPAGRRRGGRQRGAGQVGCWWGGSGPASTRSGAPSSGGTRWWIPLSRWSAPRGSPVRPPGRRPWSGGSGPSAPGSARGTWCESYWLPEADLVTLGRNSTVNRGCVVQTHLFHDRVMSIDTVTLEDGATMGPHGVILPQARIGSGGTVGPASLVMRGETVPAATYWMGNPVSPWGGPVGARPEAQVARAASPSAAQHNREVRPMSSSAPASSGNVLPAGDGSRRAGSLPARPRHHGLPGHPVRTRARLQAEQQPPDRPRRPARGHQRADVGRRAGPDGAPRHQGPVQRAEGAQVQPARRAARGGPRCRPVAGRGVHPGHPLRGQPGARAAGCGARWAGRNSRTASSWPGQPNGAAVLVPLQRPPAGQGQLPDLGDHRCQLPGRVQRGAALAQPAGPAARPGSTSRPNRWPPTWPRSRSAATSS